MPKRKTHAAQALDAIRVLRVNEKRVEKLYKEWQLLKLKTLGYTWGPIDRHQISKSLCEHFYFEPMNTLNWQGTLYINWARGGSAEIPTSWLNDRGWKTKAKKSFIDAEMMRQLKGEQ